MPYDLITDYHGKVAALPPETDLHALRHHYDMCCMENLAAQKKPGSGMPTSVRSKSITISPATRDGTDVDIRDPVKKDQAQATRDNQGGGGKSKDQEKKAQEQPSDKPLSPPLSEPEHGSTNRMEVWRDDTDGPATCTAAERERMACIQCQR
ncbi:hypothetical protein F5883DRAFT_208510 [Diaporthe sp. PMI_573]|nr:hypothetical protein F5883DRAFT_208510 [Diaporthaceae sp. PMI_573]